MGVLTYGQVVTQYLNDIMRGVERRIKSVRWGGKNCLKISDCSHIDDNDAAGCLYRLSIERYDMKKK